MADTDKKPTETPKPADNPNPFAANCLWGGVYAFAAFFLGQPQYPGGYIGVAAFFVIGFLWNPARLKKGQKTKIERSGSPRKKLCSTIQKKRLQTRMRKRRSPRLINPDP